MVCTKIVRREGDRTGLRYALDFTDGEWVVWASAAPRVP